MQGLGIHAILEQQRSFFHSGGTLPLAFRLKQLQQLKSLLIANEENIAKALYADLHKSPTEVYISEFSNVIDEINYAIRNLKKWMSPTKVPTPFPQFWPGRSTIHHDPYGVVFIIGPWNFPLLLIMSPLIGAIAAGNCVVLKPSEMATHTQALLTHLINESFPANYMTCITASPDEMEAVLAEKFDYIFYTGGEYVGKIIMQAAAKHLTPITLELGGKSPCIIDESADIDFAARRIAWAKTMNAGQVCIAPDYLLVHRHCKETLLAKLREYYLQFYGDNAELSTDYGRIINKKHFDRLKNLMKQGSIVFGGQNNPDNLYIAPPIVDNLSWDDPIMQEEIFGPLLPIITFDTIGEVVTLVNNHPKPLALYLFTKNPIHEKLVLEQISFGGGCINDCILHIANHHLPFGGVGQSGIGAYHGKFSFETFSHRKSIYKKILPLDFQLEYPPHNSFKSKILRLLLG